jgi:prolyl-tRNA editing enzyme YbaK/EbsC (Cys-tRNA(Pro) deacylase)
LSHESRNRFRLLGFAISATFATFAVNIVTLLTLDDLQAYIDCHAIQARLIRNLGHTPTVPDAARVLGVAPEQIIKTLLFVLTPGGQQDGNQPGVPPAVVVIGNGENRIDKRAVGRRFGLNPKRVKLADPATVIELLGYPAGGVPPFGHQVRLPVLVDQTVVDLRDCAAGRIFGGGGDDRTMMELSVDELLRVHQPEVLALSNNNKETGTPQVPVS